MKNIFKSKRNILIMMFALIVIMGIGFAAYSQQLKITDTSSIDSNWDIYISKVTPGTPVGGATGTGAPDPDEKTKANLTTDLKYPGDSITYTIDVTNGGTVDAEVEKVELKPLKENTVIKYSIIDEANIQYLNAGETKQFKVKVEYDPTKTGTATDDEKSNKLTLTIDYVQKGTGNGTYVPGGDMDTFTGTLYSRNVLAYNEDNFNDEAWAKENFIWPNDSIDKIKEYTEDYSTLNSNYFLKHIMNNGTVESNEICFIHNGLHCIKPNEYETSKASLLSIFGEGACGVYSSYVGCGTDDFGLNAFDDGNVLAGDGPTGCSVDSGGLAGCISGG